MTTPACWSWPVPDDFDLTNERLALYSWQAGRCAICAKSHTLVEDHDHNTGLTRGQLCFSCNTRERYDTSPVFNAYRNFSPTAILGIHLKYKQQYRGTIIYLRIEANLYRRILPHTHGASRRLNKLSLALFDEALSVWESSPNYSPSKRALNTEGVYVLKPIMQLSLRTRFEKYRHTMNTGLNAAGNILIKEALDLREEIT
jgi:hypothetical protein